MSRCLPGRALAAAGALGAVLAVGAFGVRPSAALEPPAQLPAAPYQAPPSWVCELLQLITGVDVCAQGGPAPTDPPPSTTVAPPAPPPEPPPAPPTSVPQLPFDPPTTAPPTTAPPTRAPAPITVAPALPGEIPGTTTAPPPTTVSAPPAEVVVESPPLELARPLAPLAPAPEATAPPPAPAEPAPVVAPAPRLLSPGFIEPDVRVHHPRPLPPERVPPPLKAHQSIIRSVIDSTSGPIGRRLVALAGVLCAVLLGILAARIDDRIGLVRRIQAYRHIDDH